MREWTRKGMGMGRMRLRNPKDWSPPDQLYVIVQLSSLVSRTRDHLVLEHEIVGA